MIYNCFFCCCCCGCNPQAYWFQSSHALPNMCFLTCLLILWARFHTTCIFLVLLILYSFLSISPHVPRVRLLKWFALTYPLKWKPCLSWKPISSCWQRTRDFMTMPPWSLAHHCDRTLHGVLVMESTWIWVFRIYTEDDRCGAAPKGCCSECEARWAGR